MRFHVAKKKALTAADTAYMTACNHGVKQLTALQQVRANGGRRGSAVVRYQRGAEAVVGGVERGKRLAELRKAQFAEKLHGGVVAAHDGLKRLRNS
jgi:hypothetical protein